MTAVMTARELLRQVTPLKGDCGRLCGARCCDSMEGEETGMLLFPGEERLYEGKPGWKVRPGAQGLIVICPGRCDRDERPLSCRMFPALPRETEAGVQIRMDFRARSVCPLARQGAEGLDPAFREALIQAGEALIGEEDQRGFLRRLHREQDEWKRIAKQLRGGGHV